MNGGDLREELENEWDRFLMVYIQFPEPAIPTARKCFEIMLKILLIDKGKSTEIPKGKSVFKGLIDRIEPEKGKEGKFWRIVKPLNDASHHSEKPIEHKKIVRQLIDFCDSEVGVKLDSPRQYEAYLDLKDKINYFQPRPTVDKGSKITSPDAGEEVTYPAGTGTIQNGRECSQCDENIGGIKFPVLPVIQVYPWENGGNDPLLASTWLVNNDRAYCPHCLKNDFIPVAIETILPKFREREKNRMERMMDDVISGMISESN